MYILIFKRFFDILFSLIGILFLLPIFLPVSLILLFTGEHYIIYFQKRMGYKNKEFKIWKFVTMIKNSSNIGTGLYTTRNDPRVLPFGKFLRITKINELPQFFNVLFGQMSLVGPRPLVKKTFDPYPNYVKRKIYDIKPGLSGVGSIIFRDEEKLLTNSTIPIEEYYKKEISPYKGELELWYQNNVTFYTDIMIVLITLFSVIFPKNKIIFKVFKNLPRKNCKYFSK